MPHPDAVKVVRFSPDGRVALTASWNQVRLWHAATGEPIGAPLPHQREVIDASFSHDGSAVLTRTAEGTVRIWPTTTTRPEGRRLQHRGWVTAVAINPSTKRFVPDRHRRARGQSPGLAGGYGRRARGRSRECRPDLFRRLPARRSSLRRGHTSREGLAGRRGARRSAGFPLALDGRVWSVAFSPDGRTLLTGHGRGHAQFWDVATGRE